MLLQNKTLGENVRVCCKYIMMNGVRTWVCSRYFCNEGGGQSINPGGGLIRGLGSDPTYKQTYLNEVANNNVRIADIQAEIKRRSESYYNLDPATIQTLQAELARLQARNAAIMEFLNYSPAKQNTIISQYKSGANYIETRTKSYNNTLNKVIESIPENFSELLTTSEGGLTTLSWLLLLGGGGFVVYSLVKGKKA